MIGGDDFSDDLLAQRRVMIGGALGPAAVSAAVAQLLLLGGQGDDPVEVVINSPGGSLEDAVGLLDTLRSMRAPLTIDVLGQARGSAAVVVAASPGRRRIGATASVSLRLDGPPPHTGQATAEDLLRLAGLAEDLERRVATVVAGRSGQSTEWVLDQFERGRVMFGSEAVDAGLVDEIR